MCAIAERTVSVRLAARVDSYVAAMRAAEASTTGFSRTTQRNLTQVGTSMQNVGRKMTTFVSLPIVAAGVLAVKAAVDWDSAWAGVTKTVDGTAQQLGELEQALRDMSKEVPASHAEIAAVAEAAGALGVAVEDIESFTRVMIDLGETTNLTADEAATSIAQMMNVMGTAPDKVDELGAALVHLGNNGASTERDIIQMAQRIAGAGEIVGLTEADVLGFANALASMGIEVEAGGSAFSRVITDMSKAVAQGGDELDIFAETAGMSASQFARAFREDPSAAIVSFIDGLGRIHAAGGDVFTVLDNLGLSDVRVSRALLSMTTSGDLLTESLQMGADAWVENTALTDEAAKRYETTAAKFEMVRNKIVDLFIDLGEMLLPAIEGVVNVVGMLAERFQDLPAPVQAAVGGFLALVAAAGPMIFIAGSLIRNLQGINSVLSLTGGAAKTAGVALAGVGLALGVGIAVYQAFTSEQRQTEAQIRGSSAALDDQFIKLLGASVAAGETVTQIEALALANEALSRSIAVGNEELADAASQLNISADQLLDVLVLMDADAGSLVSTMDFLGRSFGLTAEQADFVARNFEYLNIAVDQIPQGLYDTAQALGLTDDELEAVTDGIHNFLAEAKPEVIEEIALAFLNNQVEAYGYEESLVAAAEAQTGLDRQIAGNAIPNYRAYAALVAAASDEELKNAGITEELAVTIGEVDAALAGATGGFGELEEEMVSSSDAMERLQEIFDGMHELRVPHFIPPGASADLRDFLTNATFLGEAMHSAVDPAFALARAEDAVWEAAQGARDAFDEHSTSLEQNEEAGRTNRGVIMGWAADILGVADAQIAAGFATETVTQTIAHNVEALLDEAEAAGLDRGAVEALIRQLGLMPEDVATHVTLAGELFFMEKINRLLDKVDEIPESVESDIVAILDTEGARAAADYLEWYLQNIDGTVDVTLQLRNLNAVSNTVRNLGRARQSSDGRFVRGGTNMLSTLGELPGSRGDEVVLPLGDPGRMAALLGLPEVGSRVAAAFGNLMPVPSLSAPSGGGQAARADLPPIYVYNNGREITSHDIAKAIVESRTTAGLAA